jgi:tripartite-type tricarboxylate transporter receptor subunit TctC
VLPDVPAMDEFVPGYEGSGWVGVGAPKNTPAEIIDKLNGQINAIITPPAMNARFASLGIYEQPGTPAQFAKLIADASVKWAKVIRFAGIKGE